MFIDSFIARATLVSNHANLLAYDDTHKKVHGYWICIECRKIFQSQEPQHKKDCSLIKTKNYNSSRMIYVVGPKEDGFYSPFMLDAQVIVKLAKDRFHSWQDNQFRNLPGSPPHSLAPIPETEE